MEISPSKESALEEEPPQIPDHTLIARIGRGSYGDVWLARNVLGAFRAVKVLYRTHFKDERPYEREFHGIQKYEPISRSHDGLVDVLQVGHSPARDWFYYVMELADPQLSNAPIDGETYRPLTLRSELLTRQKFAYEECINHGVALAEALAFLHEKGLVHRDIKPSNIIFVHGRPKLADVGLVTEAADDVSFVGTTGFIPPEGPGSPRADLYSLGKVLYEISTGKDRGDFPELPTELGTETDEAIAREFNAIILRCCATNPEQRYESTDRLREDLLLLKAGKSVRRLHQFERRVKVAQRVGALTLLIAVLASAAAFWTAHQNKIIREKEAATSQARQDALVNLREAYLQQARANRFSDRSGRRFTSLDVLAKATAIKPGPDLRDETIACLALPDMREVYRSPDFKRKYGFCKHDYAHNRYAVVSEEGDDITIHRLFTNEELLRLKGKTNTPARFITFGPSERWMCIEFFDGSYRIVELPAGENVFESGARKIHIHGFGPGLNQITMGEGTNNWVIYDLESRKAIKSIPISINIGQAHYNSSRDKCAFLLAGPDTRKIPIVDVATGKLLFTLHDPSPVTGLVWSPDSRLLVTVSHGGAIRIWDATTGIFLNSLLDGIGSVEAAFDPTGSVFITCDFAGTTRLWAANSFMQLASIDGAGGALAFSPDGRFFCAQYWGNEYFRIFEVSRGDEWRVLPTAKGPHLSVQNDFVAASTSAKIQIFDRLLDVPVATIQSPGPADFDPKTLELAAAVNNGFQRWSISKTADDSFRIQPSRLQNLPTTPTWLFANNGASLVVVYDTDRAVHFLDTDTMAERARTEPLNDAIFLATSPDGRYAATGRWHLRDVQIWNAFSGKKEREFTSDSLARVYFSPDSRTFVIADQTDYRFFNVPDWTLSATIKCRGGGVEAPVAFSPDSSVAAIGDSRTRVRLVKVHDGATLAILTSLSTDQPTSLAFTADGTGLLVSAAKSPLGLWDLRLLRERLREMKLDWDAPEFPPANPARRLHFTVAGDEGKIFSRRPKPKIPARKTDAPSRTIDLSEYYTVALDQGWDSDLSGNNLSPLDAVREASGVPFDIRGTVQLAGDTHAIGHSFPTNTADIPVHQRCQKIHFLHGTIWNSPLNTQVATVTVNFENGTQERAPIIYGRDVLDWWIRPNLKPKEATAVPAWVGQNAASKGQGAFIGVYKLTWTNPHPEIEVESFSFSSTVKEAAPFLLAVTTE